MSVYIPAQSNDLYKIQKSYLIYAYPLLYKTGRMRIGRYVNDSGKQNNIRIPEVKRWKKNFTKSFPFLARKISLTQHISSDHLEIRQINDDIYFEDLNSQYGTSFEPSSVSIITPSIALLLTEGTCITLAPNTPGSLHVYFSKRPENLPVPANIQVERHTLTLQRPYVTLEVIPK